MRHRSWYELTPSEQQDYIFWVITLVEEGKLELYNDYDIEAKARSMYECDINKKGMSQPFSDIFKDLDIDFPDYI